MLCLVNIRVEFEGQGFKATHMGTSPDGTQAVLFMESTMQTSNVRCPKCGSSVHIHGNTQLNIKDMPLVPRISQRSTDFPLLIFTLIIITVCRFNGMY